jgi:hypothetical protein
MKRELKLEVMHKEKDDKFIEIGHQDVHVTAEQLLKPQTSFVLKHPQAKDKAVGSVTVVNALVRLFGADCCTRLHRRADATRGVPQTKLENTFQNYVDGSLDVSLIAAIDRALRVTCAPVRGCTLTRWCLHDTHAGSDRLQRRAQLAQQPALRVGRHDAVPGGHQRGQQDSCSVRGAGALAAVHASLVLLRAPTDAAAMHCTRYDSDGKMQMFGFGAQPRKNAAVSHCFALNGNESDPSVAGIDGMNTVYKDALKVCQLSGPTFAAPVIEKAAALAKVAADRVSGPLSYYVLLLLTDGEFHVRVLCVRAAAAAH